MFDDTEHVLDPVITFQAMNLRGVFIFKNPFVRSVQIV